MSDPLKDYGFEFRYQYEKGGPETVMTLTMKAHRDAALSDVLGTMEMFLIAAGYSLPGHLVIEEGGQLKKREDW